MLLEDLAGGRSHRQLPSPRALHLAAHAEDLRSAVLRATQATEPVGASAHDVGDVTERLDVVDHRRAAPEATHLREWRLRPRDGSPTFEATQQCRLLAADVAPCAAMQVQLEIEARAQDALAETALRMGIGDRSSQKLRCARVLGAQKDVGDACLDREGAEDDS